MAGKSALKRALVVVLVAHACATHAGERFRDFSSDPGWEGINNRIDPSITHLVRQDFGYSRSDHFGNGAPGEIGGKVTRSLVPARYAKRIEPKTLNDPLSASGKFCVPEAESGSALNFGWFHSSSTGWRTPNSLVFRLDGNGGRYWVFFEYGTQNYRTGGMGCFEGDRYQTTTTPPERADGTVHSWSLDYNPDGAGGMGEIRFQLDDRKYEVAPAPGDKEDGAAFDRFGIFNMETSGDVMTAYFDDLVLDGKREDFSEDPGWEGIGNRTTFMDRAIRPHHDFGFSNTSIAGGAVGEIGGLVWRIEAKSPEQTGSYADILGPLDLKSELKAEGRIAMTKAGADSAVLLGWFNAETRAGSPPPNLVGVMIEGPSRVGHYFRPVFSNSRGDSACEEEGPLLRPDTTTHSWTLHYDPGANGGLGRIMATLDGVRSALDLKPGAKEGGAELNRFGLLSFLQGGHHVEVYLDDLRYTAE